MPINNRDGGICARPVKPRAVKPRTVRVWDFRGPDRLGVLLGIARFYRCRLVLWDGHRGATVVRSKWLRHDSEHKLCL